MMCRGIGRFPIGTHGLRNARGRVRHAETQSTAEDDNVHESELPRSAWTTTSGIGTINRCSPITDEGELLDERVLKVPRKDEDEVGSALPSLAWVRNRYVRTRPKTALLVRASVDGVVHEIRSNPTVVQKGIALPGRSKPAMDFPSRLIEGQHLKKPRPGFLDPCGERGVRRRGVVSPASSRARRSATLACAGRPCPLPRSRFSISDFRRAILTNLSPWNVSRFSLALRYARRVHAPRPGSPARR